MKNRIGFSTILAVVLIVAAIYSLSAQAAAIYQHVNQSNERFLQTVQIDGATTQTGALILTGPEVSTFADVSITSPTKTFSAAGRRTVSLTTDANMTGWSVTGGTKGQRLTVISGSGSNTIRFDDNGSTMALGGNITLTEGQDDVLDLVCTNSDGLHWACIGTHDN